MIKILLCINFFMLGSILRSCLEIVDLRSESRSQAHTIYEMQESQRLIREKNREINRAIIDKYQLSLKELPSPNSPK
jgi:hypothetical protein